MNKIPIINQSEKLLFWDNLKVDKLKIYYFEDKKRAMIYEKVPFMSTYWVPS